MTSDPAPTPARRGVVTVADVAHIATRYDPANELPPEQVAARSEKLCRWICGAGPDHRYEAKPFNVYRSARGACPFCSGRRASVTNRRDVLYQQLAAEWDAEANDRPTSAVVATTEHPGWWRCRTCGHRWAARTRNRTVGGTGCPKCSKAAMTAAAPTPVPGRSLPDVAPGVAAQWHPDDNGALRPAQVAATSRKARWWQCAKGHAWEASPAGRLAKGGRGCPYCTGEKLGYGNDLATQAPEIAAEWDHAQNGTVTPATVPAAAQHLVWWRCPVGHSWKATVASRTGSGTRPGTVCPGARPPRSQMPHRPAPIAE